MLTALAMVPGIGAAAQVVSAIATFIIRCKPCMIAIGLLVAWLAGDIHGHRKEDKVCTANNYAMALAAAKRNVAVKTKAAADSEARAAQLELDNTALAKLIAEIPPAAPACRLTPAQRKALERIK